MDSRPLTPDSAHSMAATATAVNTPDRPDFPPNASGPDADSLGSLESVSSDSEDGDDEVQISTTARKYPKEAVEGWPQLAQLMADQPDFAAFPRFRDLNVKSLLYYQVELTSLRKKLHGLEYNDKADDRNYKYSLYADKLVKEKEVSEQFKTMREIRTVLKEYSTFE